jgi:hypothetical protein
MGARRTGLLASRLGRTGPLRAWTAAVLAALALLAAAPAMAQEAYRGWERDSAYNKLYSTQNSDTLRGAIERLYEATPVPGMSRGVALSLRTGSKSVTVHLGPRASLEYLIGALAPGDTVRVSGAWARVGGEAVLMAARLRRGESLEVKLRRTRDGAPYWVLTAKERTEEKLED